MVTKIQIISMFSLMLAIFPWCSGDDDDYYCKGDGVSKKTKIDNLITFYPIQSIYEKGDTITYKVIVPSNNTYFGEEMDLFEKTNAYRTLTLYFNYSLLLGNEIVYSYPEFSPEGYFDALTYDSTNNVYRLEIRIKLLRTGSYHINSRAEIRFIGIGNCNDYTINTNVQGWDFDTAKIEFEVKELEE